MKDLTAKEQIFLLDMMIGNLWLFLDRTFLLTVKFLTLLTAFSHRFQDNMTNYKNVTFCLFHIH